ncbi:hypothetical protein J6590_099870 [Homalodisca vitripennis]|nr:hypothetical protein J6590_099870 [Homalodisca vitripennis]
MLWYIQGDRREPDVFGIAITRSAKMGEGGEFVAMEQSTVENRMFAYDAYVQNGESVTTVQRLFRTHFNLGRHGTDPTRNTILRKISWPKEDRKDAGKHREGETSPHSEPKSFSKKTCK